MRALATSMVGDAPVSVRKLDEASVRDYAYDRLLDGLLTGTFGGRPVDGPGPYALIRILRDLDWPVDQRAFDAAVPHYPERFGAAEIRETLHNLGYATRRSRVAGKSLAEAGGALLVFGARGRIGVPGSGRRPSIVDVESGERRRAWSRRLHDCILVEREEASDARQRPRILGAMLTRFRPELGLILFLSLVSGVNIVAASLSIGLIFTTVLGAEALDTLAFIGMGILALLVFDLKIRRLRARIVGHLSGRLEHLLSTDVYAKLMKLPIEMVVGSTVGDQMGRLRQFETVRDFFGGPVVSVFLEVPLVLLLLLTLAVVSWPSAVVVVAGIAVCATIGAIAVPAIQAAQSTLAARSTTYSRLLSDTMDRREQIVRRGLGNAMAERLRPHLRRVAEARLAADMALRRFGAAIAVLVPLTSAGVIVIGALQIMAGAASGGTLIVCTILSMRLMAPVQQALMVAVRVPEVLGLFAQLDALFRIPDRSQTRQHASAAQTAMDRDVGPLSLKEAVFTYPSAAAPALRGVNVRIPVGSLVAVVGPSGAGKSTLLRAIVGDHALRAGRISVATLNLAQLSPDRRVNMIGHLGNDPFILYGTVAQNLRLGSPEVTVADMREVCDELGLLSAIEALPAGFETRLDRSAGAGITAAMRTKLAIARLLLRETPILLLDEPGARLSPADDARLLETLRRRSATGAICLTVTHRPSTIRDCDYALLLDGGRAVYFGPPSEMPILDTQGEPR